MGPVGLVDPWVWWGCWSGRPWAWWDRGSGGPVGLVGPWVNFKGSDMPRCPWSSFHCFLLFYALFIVVHCFLMGLCIDGSCWSGGPLGLVGLLVWWALGLVGRGWRVGFFNFGSGSGIGKNYRVGSGLGLGSGIGIIYWINRVLSGIEILDRVFPYFVIFNSLSTWLDIKFGIS